MSIRQNLHDLKLALIGWLFIVGLVGGVAGIIALAVFAQTFRWTW